MAAERQQERGRPDGPFSIATSTEPTGLGTGLSKYRARGENDGAGSLTSQRFDRAWGLAPALTRLPPRAAAEPERYSHYDARPARVRLHPGLQATLGHWPYGKHVLEEQPYCGFAERLAKPGPQRGRPTEPPATSTSDKSHFPRLPLYSLRKHHPREVS